MIYKEDGSARTHYVYLAIAAPNEVGYSPVKIGRTMSIGQRLTAISGSCAVPISEFRFVDVVNHRNATRVEAELHSWFRKRRTHGEWFLFDLRLDEEQKRLLTGVRRALLKCGAPLNDLEGVDADAFREFQGERQKFTYALIKKGRYRPQCGARKLTAAA